MSGSNKALIVGIVATLGLWGCARGPSNNPAAGERIRALESKVSKLEEDFRAAAASRDLVRQKLAAVDDHLKLAVKERDELRKQVAVRTNERDNAQTQFEQFRKNIRDLLGQAEAASGPLVPQPVTANAPAHVARPS